MEIDVSGIEAQVCQDIAARQKLGINKYGVTVENNPLTLREWLTHLYQEQLDACIYTLRSIKEIESCNFGETKDTWSKVTLTQD